MDERKLAKIALLHDIGKSEHKLNVIEKSALVVLDRFMNGKFIKYSNNKKVDLYYNHPKKSINMLKKSNGVYDKEFLEAIEKHHYKNIGSNIYLKIIKECDDNN
ncbi:MAG: HD domain-containing protein [Clostridium paraputrificum]